ncbi:hypothetical protein FACS189475_01340 [Betaproteobacteria bacterium]|nr:hypothetical protein FACS189475_01340 [Betaproteobacteria bacterium]
MKHLTRSIFTALSEDERKALLLRLTDKLEGFTFSRFEHFERYGQASDSAVYLYRDGSEFVFVPGDTVMLGWNGFVMGMDEETREDISGSLAGYDIEDVEGFLREQTSPVRQALVQPLLVEREVREIGWYDVPPDDPVITGNAVFAKYLKEYMAEKPRGSFELHNSLKLSGENGRIKAQLYAAVGYAEFVERIAAEGFRLPTADEWEYLCGGGARTLWPWGDSFDYHLEVPYFNWENTSSGSIAAPNHFGLSIGFNPYKQEVVMDSPVILKGGDGGQFMCGGAGPALSFLPLATAYKGYDPATGELDYLDDVGGDYTFYRRVLRL